MAHLFKQIYVNDIDFEAMTAEKLIGLVFTEIYRLVEATLSKKMKLTGINGQSLESALRCWTRKKGEHIMLNMLSTVQSRCNVARNH